MSICALDTQAEISWLALPNTPVPTPPPPALPAPGRVCVLALRPAAARPQRARAAAPAPSPSPPSETRSTASPHATAAVQPLPRRASHRLPLSFPPAPP
eukprot:6202862-Pleurochrysis_carterae.AAC.1